MLVSDIKEYFRLKGEAHRLFLKDTNYPNNVFKQRYPYYYFLENNFGKEWAVLKAIVKLEHDTQIKFFCLEPDGEEFWKPTTGHFGCFELSLDATKSEWNLHLNFASDPGKTYLSSYPGKFAIFGNTDRWVVFVNMTFDLSIVGTHKKPDSRNPFIRYFHDVAWAIQYWRYTSSVMDDAVYTKLEQEYSSKVERPI